MTTITIRLNLLGLLFWLGVLGAIIFGVLALMLGSTGFGATAIICGCVALLMFVIAFCS